MGTRDAYLAIRSDDQLENRFQPMTLPVWRDDDEFATLLASFGAVLPLRRPSPVDDPGIRRYIIEKSEGTIGEIAELLRSAAAVAIETEEEAITRRVLRLGEYEPLTERRPLHPQRRPMVWQRTLFQAPMRTRGFEASYPAQPMVSHTCYLSTGFVLAGLFGPFREPQQNGIVKTGHALTVGPAMSKRCLPYRRRCSLAVQLAWCGIGAFLAGCNLPSGVLVAEEHQPCFASTEEVDGNFLLTVENVWRTERLERPGLQHIPEEYRPAIGQQAYIQPQAEFLVVDLRMENITNRPQAWSSYQTNDLKGYGLVRDDNSLYRAAPELSDINRGTGSDRINPGMAAKGSIVFDVPRGNYDFIIVESNQTGVGAFTKYFQSGVIFRCSLGQV